MRNFLRKMFNNEVVFGITALISEIIILLGLVYYIFTGFFVFAAINGIYAIGVILLFISYVKQNKNTAKFIIGFLFGIGVIGAVLDFVDALQYGPYWIVLISLMLLEIIIMCVTHFAILTGKESKPRIMTVQNVVIIITVITTILIFIESLRDPGIEAVIDGLVYLGFSMLLTSAICVDNKLEIFKK